MVRKWGPAGLSRDNVSMGTNKLTLNEPIAIPSLKYVTIDVANGINDTAKEFTLAMSLYAEGGVRHPNGVNFYVSDGECDCLTVNEAPASTQEVFVISRVTTDDNPEVEHAFSNALGVYFQGGATGVEGAALNAVLNYLQSIHLLPAGVAG